MEQYAGIDVSLDSASVCIVDAQGKILKEAKVACEPEALIAWFAAHGTPMARIGLEAGPLSQWLFAGLKAAGLPVELLETRHVRAAFKAMPVKTDRQAARGIAQLMRLGWFRPVHCKSLPAQEVRALLTTRKFLLAKPMMSPTGSWYSGPCADCSHWPLTSTACSRSRAAVSHRLRFKRACSAAGAFLKRDAPPLHGFPNMRD